MRNLRATIVNGILVAAIFAVAALAIHKIPAGAQVAIHWGPDNRADAWVGGSAIHLINPVIALVIWFVASFFPQGFASKPEGVSTAQARLPNILLIQLIIQLLMALYLRSA
jgi:zinc transporter ZupT